VLIRGLAQIATLTCRAAGGLQSPRVPRHEVIGRIDSIGLGVEEWRVGDGVGMGFLGGHCGKCCRLRRDTSPANWAELGSLIG
jgi:D-arabinose 1-dehydrogenase-like Zn-dependent alcohol dehydrogenase